MAKILRAGETMQPRIVSLSELKAKLIPLCLGYTWAEKAVTDLWLKGAPVPQAPDQPERRILIPIHFAKWWEEVRQRMGVNATPEQVYKLAAKNMLRSAGHRQYK